MDSKLDSGGKKMLPNGRISSFMQKWFWKIVLTSAGIYILFFTIVWGVLWALAIAGVYNLTQIGVPENKQPHYRDYLRQQPVLRAMCNFSNWVADYTQPIISDEVMAAHWDKHHVEWEETVKNYLLLPKDSPDKYVSLMQRLPSLGLSSISGLDQLPNLERFVNLTPHKSLAPTQSLRVCVGRGGSLKYYTYYPYTAPVLYEGEVMTPSTLEFYQKNRKSYPGALGIPVVETTNSIHYGNGYSMRQLNANWFINRSD